MTRCAYNISGSMVAWILHLRSGWALCKCKQCKTTTPFRTCHAERPRLPHLVAMASDLLRHSRSASHAHLLLPLQVPWGWCAESCTATAPPATTCCWRWAGGWMQPFPTCPTATLASSAGTSAVSARCMQPYAAGSPSCPGAWVTCQLLRQASTCLLSTGQDSTACSRRTHASSGPAARRAAHRIFHRPCWFRMNIVHDDVMQNQFLSSAPCMCIATWKVRMLHRLCGRGAGDAAARAGLGQVLLPHSLVP